MSSEVVRFYTRARKFPQLIGRTPDGRRIPGGPYTVTQFVGAGVAAVVLWKTSFAWARLSGPLNIAIFLAAVAATVYVLGRLPQGGRNPLSMLAGAGKAAAATPSAAARHRAPRLAPPHSYRGVVEILTVDPQLASEPVREPVPARRSLAGASGLVAIAGR